MGAEAPSAARTLAARYRVGALLGRGGMAEVYDAFDERLHRQVAVKVLRPEMAADPAIRARFEVEARAAASLSHPNVVAVYDTGEDAGTPFIVMERLPGETLADRMAAGPVDEAWLGRVAGDVLGALGAAHRAGIVHRDVKPGNILLGADGCAKVADFGIAKSIEQAGDITGTGLLVGTPAYLAPERIDGQPATPASDLYAVGVVLYEALAGVKPFTGDSPTAVAEAVLDGRHRPLTEVRPGVDEALAGAVEWAMSRDPALRPRSAADLARSLRGRAPAPTRDHTAVLAVPPVRTGGGRGRVLLLAGAALLLLLLVVGLALGGRDQGVDASRGSLAGQIDALAVRVRVGDGPEGPEAADRLGAVAAAVRAGGGADEANALLADAATWAQEGTLSTPAVSAMAGVLGSIPGVDPSLATSTTTTTTVVVDQPKEGDGGHKGRKRGKGQDD
ncbi:MAG TPA: serine/threonine-protein kinase [Acidimicrobiales bacterium]|nr:serine/threonine-protein kinase [Acidimicrobiales bacterium]